MLLALAGLLAAPITAVAQSGDVCRQLESELARLQAPQAPVSDAAVRRMERARQAAQAAENRARRAGCFQRGFLIFQPQKPAACRKLEADYNRANNVYRDLAAQVGGANRPSGGKAVRDRVIRALAANNCGSQYARYANANRRSVLSFFLGPEVYVEEPQAPRGGGYRTLCVRTCDGYYFPISFSTYSDYFGKDEDQCRQACPGAEVHLYAYRNPGEQPEEAKTPSGEPITSLANAFRYRNEVVDGCSCRLPQEAGGPQDVSRVSMTFSPGLVAEDKDGRTVPMPRRRPSRYAISDIENPSVPVELERKDAQTSAIMANDEKRHVRVIGPQFFYAR